MSAPPPIRRAQPRHPLPPLFLPFRAVVAGVAGDKVRLSDVCWARTGQSAIDGTVDLPAGAWSKGLRVGDVVSFTTGVAFNDGGWRIEAPHRVTVTRAATI